MFIENVGQFDSNARFQVRGGNATTYLADDALWFTVLENAAPDQAFALPDPLDAKRNDKPRKGVNLKVSFPGANPHPRLEPFNRLDTHVSYFIGNDSPQWHSDVPVWGGVRYVDLYPGVDLEIASEGGQWAWRLTANGAPSTISDVRLRVEGAEAITTDETNLHLNTAVGNLSLPLFASPESSHPGQPAPTILGDEVVAPFTNVATDIAPDVSLQSLTLNNAADRFYASYFGASGVEQGTAIAVDANGAAYITGLTSTPGIPTTPGAFDTTIASGDVFVSKFDMTASGGDSLIYSTYLGGDFGTDRGWGIAVDSNGIAYITGDTSVFDNFPTTANAYTRTTFGNGGSFVTQLNANGTGLLYSTLFGYGGADAIAVHTDGTIYITGQTGSANLPVKGAYDSTYGGGTCNPNPCTDAFVAKFNPVLSGTASLLYSTYLGGNSKDDYGYGIAVDASGAAYMTGYTASSKNAGFPLKNAYDSTLGGTFDAFVLKLNPALSGTASLLYSTYLGGRDNDYGYAIAVNAAGQAYVTGFTGSSDFPKLGAYDTTLGGIGDAFVAKLNPSASGSASLLYSTYLGGSGGEYGNAIALDGSGKVYVTGDTLSSDLQTTANAFIQTCPSCPTYYGGFVAKLDPAIAGSSGLLYGSYLGGSNQASHGKGIAVDAYGAMYVTGETEASDFPANNRAYDQFYNGSWDAFIAKLGAGIGCFNLTKVVTPLTSGTLQSRPSNCDSGDYQPGTVVVLTATPAAGYVFSSWSGDVVTTSNPLTLTMNGNKSLTATFAQCYVLTPASNPASGGDVTPSPSNCAGSGYHYAPGTVITLTAVPEPSLSAGYAFTSWSGDVTGTTNPITLTMNANKNVIANFVVCYTLTTSVTPTVGGGVNLSPNNCSGTGYSPNTVVTLTAVPVTPTYALSGWSGDASGLLTNPFTFTMPSNNANVTAHFAKAMNVYIIVYTNTVVAPGDAAYEPDPIGHARTFSANLIQNLSTGTVYHGYTSTAPYPYPSLTWRAINAQNGSIIHTITGSTPTVPCPAGYICNGNILTADYSQIFDRVNANFADNLCSLINSGQVQEVWIWADRSGYLAERVAIGPTNGYTTTLTEFGQHNIPDCNGANPANTDSQYAVMGFNFEHSVPLANAMESYAHRLEDAFDVLFPCEFDVPLDTDPSWTWVDPIPVNQAALKHDCGSSRGFTARAHNISEVAQCGLAHWSPNVTWDTENSGIYSPIEYYGYQVITLTFQTGCNDWKPNPTTFQTVITPTITCQDARVWQCNGGWEHDKLSFHIWWMQNLPGLGNTIYRCDDDTVIPTLTGNWWDYLRGDIPNPNEAQNSAWRCNSTPPAPRALSGQVVLGQLAGATLTLYSLEVGGELIPITFATEVHTAVDGSYTTPALPSELNGKTLVVQASGGSFVDEATGQKVSFEGYSLYSVIPSVDLNRPLGGMVTPFTDIAFRLTQHALHTDASRSPVLEATYYNTQVAAIFGLLGDTGSPFGPTPFDLTLIRPANLFDGRSHPLWAWETTYALALAGLSQQVSDAGVSPAEWVRQFSADADDGLLDSAAAMSAHSLEEAKREFLTGPQHPRVEP